MEEKIPAGEWITVSEAMKLIDATGKPVTRRRVQNLAADGVVASVKVLGRVLLDRKALSAWAKGPRSSGRPSAAPSTKGKVRGKKK